MLRFQRESCRKISEIYFVILLKFLNLIWALRTDLRDGSKTSRNSQPEVHFPYVSTVEQHDIFSFVTSIKTTLANHCMKKILNHPK